jgi:hypothetical protein
MGPEAVGKEPNNETKGGGKKKDLDTAQSTKRSVPSVHWACAVKILDRGKTVEAELTSFLERCHVKLNAGFCRHETRTVRKRTKQVVAMSYVLVRIVLRKKNDII